VAKEKMLSAGVIPTTSTVLTGEHDDDPAATAAAYLNKHHINVLFEKLCAALIYHKPEKPREFLVEQLAQLEKSGGVCTISILAFLYLSSHII
jgi:spore germination cell wall hydrolase CwlJ-like protein